MDELKTDGNFVMYDPQSGNLPRTNEDYLKKLAERANEWAREELSDKGVVFAKEIESYVLKELGILDDPVMNYRYTRLKEIATDLAICSDETGIDYDYLSGWVETLVKDEGMPYDEAVSRVTKFARRGIR